MKNLSSIQSAILFLILIPSITAAANPLDVVINEIAWMGTTNSANDEWLELYNNTDNSINLDGWQLIAQDGTPKITLSGIIPVNSFYLLERTNDDTVPGISADKIYTGALGNNGENLKLYDSSNNVIDGVDCSTGWFAGLGKPEYKTMERINSLVGSSDSSNWQTSQNPGGTPKTKNSIVVQTEPQPQTKFAEPAVGDSHQQVYPSGIIINEILPSPEGPDTEEEWIEVFNQNNFEVDLSNWQITDIEGKTTTFTFLAGTKITSNGFLVLSRPTTKITLNNDGDGLNLIQPDGKIIDSVTYEKAPRAQSYNRIDSQLTWSTVLTPGTANIIPKSVAEEKIGENVPKEEVKEKIKPEQGLAAIGKQIPEEKTNFFSIFSVAFTIAIFAGVIILILKKQMKKVYNKKI